MIHCCTRFRIAIIIGCLNIIAYLLVCVVVSENMKYDRYSDYDYDDLHDVYKSYEHREQARVHREFYCTIYVTVCAVMVLLSGLLIFGVVKKRPRFISPWLLMSFVVLIYSSIIILDDIFVKGSFQGVANAVLFFVTLFVIFGFQIGCLALVYSVYNNFELEIVLQRLREPTSDKAPNNDCHQQQRKPNNISHKLRSLDLSKNSHGLEREVHQLKLNSKKLTLKKQIKKQK